MLEKVALGLIDNYLGDTLKETGKLCYAGGVALNVKLNQRIIARPDVKELFVQPASSDAVTRRKNWVKTLRKWSMFI